jgi:hypothetical protein
MYLLYCTCYNIIQERADKLAIALQSSLHSSSISNSSNSAVAASRDGVLSADGEALR